MRAVKVPARAALEWLTGGVALLKRERERWLGSALVYLIGAAALHRLPFLGDLVLILLTPLALGSLLLLAEHETVPPPVALERSNWRALLHAYLVQPARPLLRIVHDPERLLPALMLSILVLGGVVAAQIIGYLLIGGSPVGGINTAALAVGGRPTCCWGCWWCCCCICCSPWRCFYSVPLCVLHGLTPPAALFELPRRRAQRSAARAFQRRVLRAVRADRQGLPAFAVSRLPAAVHAGDGDAGLVPRRRLPQLPGALPPPRGGLVPRPACL